MISATMPMIRFKILIINPPFFIVNYCLKYKYFNRSRFTVIRCPKGEIFLWINPLFGLLMYTLFKWFTAIIGLAVNGELPTVNAYKYLTHPLSNTLLVGTLISPSFVLSVFRDCRSFQKIKSALAILHQSLLMTSMSSFSLPKYSRLKSSMSLGRCPISGSSLSSGRGPDKYISPCGLRISEK